MENNLILKNDENNEFLPIFSIVMACYNVENYIDEAISSVINQSLDFKNNIEIILVDDGSSDSSPKICDEYAKKDNRIIVIHEENLGQAIARNVALKIAKRKIYNVFRC